MTSESFNWVSGGLASQWVGEGTYFAGRRAFYERRYRRDFGGWHLRQLEELDEMVANGYSTYGYLSLRDRCCQCGGA